MLRKKAIEGVTPAPVLRSSSATEGGKAGVQKCPVFLDSGFRRNGRRDPILIFYEISGSLVPSTRIRGKRILIGISPWDKAKDAGRQCGFFHRGCGLFATVSSTTIQAAPACYNFKQ
jgi:hypothetical protein